MWKTKESVFINIDKNLLFVIIHPNPRPMKSLNSMNIVRIITLVIIMVTNFGSEARAQYVLPGMAPDLDLVLTPQSNGGVMAQCYVPNPDQAELLVNIHYSQNLTLLADGLGPDAATGVVSQFETGYTIEGFTDPLPPGPPYYFRVQIVAFTNLQALGNFMIFGDTTGLLYRCHSDPVPYFIDISTGLTSIDSPTGVVACPEGIRIMDLTTEEVSVYGLSGSLIYHGRPRGDGVIPLPSGGVMMVQIGQSRPIKIFRGT